MVDTRYAEMILVHFMKSCLFNTTDLYIPHNQGLLYHYSERLVVGGNNSTIVDQRMKVFQETFMKNINERYQLFDNSLTWKEFLRKQD